MKYWEFYCNTLVLFCQGFRLFFYENVGAYKKALPIGRAVIILRFRTSIRIGYKAGWFLRRFCSVSCFL